MLVSNPVSVNASNASIFLTSQTKKKLSSRKNTWKYHFSDITFRSIIFQKSTKFTFSWRESTCMCRVVYVCVTMFLICITCLENAQKIFYGTKIKSHAPLKKLFLTLQIGFWLWWSIIFQKSTKCTFSWRESTCMCRVVPKIIWKDSLDLKQCFLHF